MRYETELQGDTLIIRFAKTPPETMRDTLKEFGYKYYFNSNSWVGKRRKDEVYVLLMNWNRRCQSLEQNKNVRTTLCWGCKNALGWCSWSRDFKPVDGWKAKRRDIRIQSSQNGKQKSVMEESYLVIECPEYERG